MLKTFISKLFNTKSWNLSHGNILRPFSQIQREEVSKRILTKLDKPTPQEELILTAVSDGKVPTSLEWTSLKTNVMAKGNYINRVNFDAKTISCCIAYRNFEAAKSYLNFIQTHDGNLNIGTVGKFMYLYYVCNDEDMSVNVEEENNIIFMYKKLKNEHPVLASVTYENVIHALSLTREWKECLKLLEKIKILDRASGSTYTAIVRAAFKNKDYSTAWHLLDEMISMERIPPPSVYKSWLKEIKLNNTDVMGDINKLLNFFTNNDIHPSKDVTDNILTILRPLSYSGMYTKMLERGQCQCCKKFLQDITLDEDDFQNLKASFMNSVIIGKNVFQKTTPAELERFNRFIKETSPWDVVVDGLNVAFTIGNQHPERYAKLIANVVNHFRRLSKKVLILGRKHMSKWPRQHMNYINANADLFLLQDISYDDPFLLYATMSSGLGTTFLSRDLMRGHAYLLMDPKLKKLFRRWQQLHQYSIKNIRRSGEIHLEFPLPILPTVQVHENGWHIPYVEIFKALSPATLDPPQDWLCIRKINSL